MKLNKTISRFAAGVLLLGFVACTANYEDINRNPYQPDKDDMQADDYLLGAVMLNLQDKMMPEQENFAQYVDCLMPGGFSGYVADSNLGTGWSGRFATYNPSQNWIEIPFNDFYTKFYPNYFQLINQSENEIYLALADLFRVATMVRVTDTYGPIPYSQVGVSNSISSPYDSQQEVYTTMFEQLDAVIGVLTEQLSVTIPSKSDRIYAGSIEKWCRFANTLKLRMAMRVVYADEELARTKAEEAVNSEVGVMTVQADGAFRKVADHNPWERFMPNWKDARISADLTAYMNGYNDPRREAYYGKTTFRELKEQAYKDIAPTFDGLRRGIEQGTYDPSSHGYSCMKVTVADDILVMPASEAAFLCAEGALRGWNMKGIDAKTWYEKGVELSFAERGVNGVDDYLAGDTRPAAYVDPLGLHSGTTGSTVTVAWNAGAGFEENLERIITQKWIAIFPNCMEAWSECRRTGYPRLMPVVANLSGGKVSDSEGARRLPYPDKEYRENGENVQAAVAKLAAESSKSTGDNMGTHVWWDCNPNIKQEMP